LLGRRSRIEYAVAMDSRHPTAQRHFGVRSRPLEPRGEFPRNMLEVMSRELEIRYSSRTLSRTDRFRHLQRLGCAIAGLLERLPDDLRNGPEAQLLSTIADRKVCNVVHLTYRAPSHEGHSKDYEFSRLSMEQRWRAGYYDAVRTLRHPEVLRPPTNRDGVLAADGRE